MSVTFFEAALAVLERAGEPLHYKEITRRALDEGLITSEGQTPEATMYAFVSVDLKRMGDESRFRRIRPGVIALREWPLDWPQAALDEASDERVRVPWFPPYREVQLVLLVWEGRPAAQITHRYASRSLQIELDFGLSNTLPNGGFCHNF